MRLNSLSKMKVASSPSARSRRMRLLRLTVVWALLGCVLTSVEAADDAAAAARATLARIQALRKERPNDGVLVFYEALIHVSLGERDAAFQFLRSLKGRKLGLVPVHDSRFDPVWNDRKFQTIRKELADEEPQTPASPVAFRLKDPKLIPEGIAFDAKGQRFFIGSIAQRKIVVTDAQGHARDFSSPEAMQLNELAVAPDGTLYVSDSMSSTLFRKKPDESKLTRFGAAGALRGANGIAVGGDGILYAAISTGIVRVDTATGGPARLPQPDTVVTGGIDGLYWHEGDLIGVQNVTNSGRVVRIALTDKGTRIADLTVLQSHHHPDFNEPTTGAIA